MADGENVLAVTVEETTAADSGIQTNITFVPEMLDKSLVVEGGPGSDVAAEGNQTSKDLVTSHFQEKSNNSHPHDSEYDTASDLDGNEEYDDEIDDSLTEDDDSEDDTETDDDEEVDDEDVRIDVLQSQEKIDAEAEKKVDEDRRNPQYIPKRGTFYEHDDRTGEMEGEAVVCERQESRESPVIQIGTGNVSGTKTNTTPTISTASKTMKKWQQASAVNRWSHDRFDLSEQAPKSRTELVNAYGYDIRTEDAPPKARRRRRYGRGPSKYNRNWEDESAYLKINNKERKPPKPSDFPALNENSSNPRRARRTREEKENRTDRRKHEDKTGEGKTERTDKMESSSRNYDVDDHDYRESRSDRSDRNDTGYKQQNRHKFYNNRGQGQNQASMGRQTAMEFKQKNRQNYQNTTFNSSNLSSRLEAQRQPQQQQAQIMAKKSTNVGGTVKEYNQSTSHSNQQQPQHYDNYNSNKKKHLELGYETAQTLQQNVSFSQQPPHQQLQQSQQPPSMSHGVNKSNQIQNTAPQQPTSNLSQRLQQVQNRNDPSHVGSVQMHALATQNQQQQQLIQQQAANMMTGSQQQSSNISQQPMEQRGPPKRYSSLRRSQHDGQHIADHQQQQIQQQMHMQQQQNQAPPPMMMPNDQVMLQANLMQMFHQENLQAQMQALQVTQQPTVAKQSNYAAQGPQAPAQQPYPGSTPTPAAYYVASDAYTAAATAAVTAQATQAAATYAAQQPNPSYLAQQQTAPAASLVYNNPNNSTQQPVTAAAAYGQTAQGSVSQSQASTPTAAGYQNYNTVGGTTYFVPPSSQTSSRPVSLPQRRPTNAIPILPPSEKNKQQKSQDIKNDTDSKLTNQQQSSSNHPPIGSAENIDHIIDNMFVQRSAFQPPPVTTSTTTPAATAAADTAKMLASSNDASTTVAETVSSTKTSFQDNNTLTTENVNKTTNDTITAGSSSTVNSTESSNNNQISAQE